MLLTNTQFQQLAQPKNSTCVSIYIPTYRAGNTQEDQLRFKNALKESGNYLKEQGFSEQQALRYLKEGYGLLDDENFWSHLSDGLAVFISEDSFEYHILPVNFNPFVDVSNTFYLRPLIPLLNGEDRFFLLALSQNEVRFFEGTRYSISPVKIDDLVPANMEEALNIDEVGDALQAHSGNGQQAQVYHGHAPQSDQKRADLKAYFREVDNGLMKMLHDEQAPMILAAVDYLIPIYREVSGYDALVNPHISGNPESADPVLLHEKAWSALKGIFSRQRKRFHHQFTQYLNDGKAGMSIADVVLAAEQGRIKALFIDKDAHVWGTFHIKDLSLKTAIKKEPHMEDLLERAAVLTYQKGGLVYQVEKDQLPASNTPIAAIYRY
jgi:hypothetical protein